MTVTRSWIGSAAGVRPMPGHRYKPAAFFLLAFALSWVPWIAGARLSAQPETRDLALLLSLLGLAGPALAAFGLILVSCNPPLRTDFRGRLLDVRALRSKYALALVGIPVGVVVLSIGVSTLFGYSTDQFRVAVDLSGALPMIVIGVFLAPAIEEIGWRGYGVDALRSRMSFLGTSLVFGVLWSLWHAPLVLIQGTYQHELASMNSPVYLANFFVSVVALATVMNWLYFRLYRSIPAAMIFHGTVNLMAMSMAADQFSKVLVTIVYLITGVVLVATTRRVASREPRPAGNAAQAAEQTPR